MSNATPIIVSQIFNVPASRLWAAITTVEEMQQWFFDNIGTFNPEVDFYTEFNVKTPERNFLHQWKIIEVIDGKKIVYDWSYKEYPGKGIVTFQLTKMGDQQTKLEVISENMDSFPQDIPEFSRDSCTAGWTYFINQRLLEYLN